MRIPGAKLVRRGLWHIRGRLFGGGVVLGYHRVAEADYDPWDMCVSPALFDAQMEMLQRNFRPVSLTELAQGESSARGPVPVAVTFDDGYDDVRTAALPVLERREIPATLFVVEQAMREGFWWDRIECLFDPRRRIPDALELDAAGGLLLWKSSQGRPALRNALHAALRALERTRREEALAMLSRWANLTAGEMTAPPVLGEQQVRELDAHPLVEIGSHSATHPELPSLSGASLEREIAGSRRRLNGLLERDVESFSYPHGLMSEEIRSRVRGAGYLRACASRNGLVARGQDPYCLPRLWPSSQSSSQFRRWLRSWTGR